MVKYEVRVVNSEEISPRFDTIEEAGDELLFLHERGIKATITVVDDVTTLFNAVYTGADGFKIDAIDVEVNNNRKSFRVVDSYVLEGEDKVRFIVESTDGEARAFVVDDFEVIKRGTHSKYTTDETGCLELEFYYRFDNKQPSTPKPDEQATVSLYMLLFGSDDGTQAHLGAYEVIGLTVGTTTTFGGVQPLGRAETEMEVIQINPADGKTTLVCDNVQIPVNQIAHRDEFFVAVEGIWWFSPFHTTGQAKPEFKLHLAKKKPSILEV